MFNIGDIRVWVLLVFKVLIHSSGILDLILLDEKAKIRNRNNPIPHQMGKEHVHQGRQQVYNNTSGEQMGVLFPSI